MDFMVFDIVKSYDDPKGVKTQNRKNKNDEHIFSIFLLIMILILPRVRKRIIHTLYEHKYFQKNK